MMVGMKSRDVVAEEPKVEKGKTFGTVSTITTEANQEEQGAAARTRATADQETTTPLELGDLMAKLDHIDKKLKHSEEDREVIKKELRYKKHEYLDNYFNLARAREEKLQQMSDKVEATDGERDKNIKKDMQEIKQRYDAVNSQLGSLETRMDTMRRDQAESSCGTGSLGTGSLGTAPESLGTVPRRVLGQYLEVLGQYLEVLRQYLDVLGQQQGSLGTVHRSVGTVPGGLGMVQKSGVTVLKGLKTGRNN